MARLTKEQWSAARNKWESDPREGFDWLVAELSLEVSRQAVSKAAKAQGWVKGGASERCSKCKEVKRLTEFNKNKSRRNGFNSQCKLCTKERHDLWKKNNPGKELFYAGNYRKNNYKKYNFLTNERKKKAIKLLSDLYIRDVLKLTKDQATPDLIELKREELQITRLLRNLDNAIKQRTNTQRPQNNG